jgi:hypothetical protein
MTTRSYGVTLPAMTRPSFWHEYKFLNPLTKTVEPKATYCERVNATVVCGGIDRF